MKTNLHLEMWWAQFTSSIWRYRKPNDNNNSHTRVYPKVSGLSR
jgi:hypothetical protein